MPPPPRPRGGKAWFAFEAKSFDIEVGEMTKGLEGCIWDRRKGVTLWIRFKGFGLSCVLGGLEACARAPRSFHWVSFWEEEGRQYKMERGSNKAGGFIRCSVRDLGKSFNLTFPKGKRLSWRVEDSL